MLSDTYNWFTEGFDTADPKRPQGGCPTNWRWAQRNTNLCTGMKLGPKRNQLQVCNRAIVPEIPGGESGPTLSSAVAAINASTTLSPCVAACDSSKPIAR